MSGCPVVDPSHFDHFSPDVAGPAFWDFVHALQARGPVSWVESYGGYWAVVGHEEVLKAAQDWETFCSGEGTSITRASPDVLPYIMPVDIDPPRQRTYRQQVNPHLTIRTLDPLEESIRAIADELLDEFAGADRIDATVAFTRRLPGMVLFRLIFGGVDGDFAEVEQAARVLTFDPDKERSAAAARRLREWAEGMLEQRGDGDPDSDVIAAIGRLRDTGVEFADHELCSGLQIFVQGGIGTSGHAMGTVLRMLAELPDVQARVRAEPELVPVLVEECLRLEPPAALMFRTVTRDVTLGGCEMHAGDKIAIFFAAANRDPALFDHPDDLDLDRPHYRHLTFGAGPHRCLGSNLARLQVRVAIEEFVARTPPFRVDPDAEVRYAHGQVRGLASLPLVFDRSGRE